MIQKKKKHSPVYHFKEKYIAAYITFIKILDKGG